MEEMQHKAKPEKLLHHFTKYPITQWLTSSTHCVVVDGEGSEHVHVKSGVPQGTVLGPLMFLIYINDIVDNINSETHIRLFADDCVLYRKIHSRNDSESLQEDLNSLTGWASRWQMSFNTAKCRILRVTTKKEPTSLQLLQLQNE